MIREDRYIVLKKKDLELVPDAPLKQLHSQLDYIKQYIPKREYWVVESDWPEYEIVSGLLSERVSREEVLQSKLQEQNREITLLRSRIEGYVDLVDKHQLERRAWKEESKHD